MKTEADIAARAIRNMLIVIAVPMCCLIWHYRFILPGIIMGH